MDRDYKLLPLSFERGVNEFFEASMIPVGATTVLRNWVPNPSGELRVRMPWSKGSTASAPATRRNVGIGYFSRNITPGIIQVSAAATAASGGGTTVSMTPAWPTDTTKGSTLVLVTAVGKGTASSTTPTDWTSVVISSNTSNRPRVAIYYMANADSLTGTVTAAWTSMPNNVDASAYLLEISGTPTTSPLGVTASSSAAASTSIASGTTSATSQAVNLVIAALADIDVEDQTAPTNNFNQLVENQSDTDLTLGIYFATTTATGAQSTAVTTATSGTNAGAIASFKSWFTAVPTAGQQSVTRYVTFQNDTSEYDIFLIDRETVSSATWTNLSSIIVADPTRLVATGTGLAKMWFTETQFTNPYHYDGVGVTPVTFGPPGRCITVHKNRVWIGGTNAQPGRLWYSNINDGTTYDAENFIDVLRDSGEAIEDIVAFEDTLLIGTRTSLFSLAGSGPDNFVLSRFPIGGCAPGRTLMVTPYGALAAGRKNVWLIANGQVSMANRPIFNSYGMTGTYMTTSYINDIVYINDNASGTTWAINAQTGTWHEERVDLAAERPAILFNHDEMQLMGPKAATVGSLLNYRLFPGSTRGKDFDTLTETFAATTPEYWPVGPEHNMTPRYLFLKLRQRGGNQTQTPLSVTPYYNGETGTVKRIIPRASAGVYRERIDLGEKQGIYYIQFAFNQTLLSTEAACWDIEEATLGYYVETVR